MSAKQYARDNGFVQSARTQFYECLYCGGAVINLSKHRSRCKRFVVRTPVYEPIKRKWCPHDK